MPYEAYGLSPRQRGDGSMQRDVDCAVAELHYAVGDLLGLQWIKLVLLCPECEKMCQEEIKCNP